MFYQFNHLGSADYLKIEHGQDFHFPPHLHQCFEMIIILEGEMVITVDDTVYTVKEKEALMIFPNQIHSLASTKSRHMLCIFSPRLVQAYSSKIAGKVPSDNLFIPDSYIINTLCCLKSESTDIEKKGILYLLCGQFEKSACYKLHKADSDNLLFKIFSFVETEFSGDCSLAHLAKLSGYDYSYLSRFFKKIVGISFNAYVQHYRLSHACYLLENTTLPIIQCAAESGYVSLRSFNRNFKIHFDSTPVQYRNSKKV